jgi:hypothetical protein
MRYVLLVTSLFLNSCAYSHAMHECKAMCTETATATLKYSDDQVLCECLLEYKKPRKK